MQTPRKAYINSKIANKNFISLAAEQLFLQLNTVFFRDRKHLLYQNPSKVYVPMLRSQNLANFCIINAAVLPCWEPNLISLTAHNKSSHTTFSES